MKKENKTMILCKVKINYSRLNFNIWDKFDM